MALQFDLVDIFQMFRATTIHSQSISKYVFQETHCAWQVMFKKYCLGILDRRFQNLMLIHYKTTNMMQIRLAAVTYSLGKFFLLRQEHVWLLTLSVVKHTNFSMSAVA